MVGISQAAGRSDAAAGSRPPPHPWAMQALDLEREAVLALRQGDVRGAFRLADRRCRVAPPEPRCFVLRAEAFDRLGARDLALADLQQALAMAPEDVLANQRLMLWSDGEERLGAAAVLACSDADLRVRGQALGILDTAGRRRLARIDILDRRIVGWVAWDGRAETRVEIGDGEASARWSVAADPAHALAGQRAYATFDLPRPRSADPLSVRVIVAEQAVATVRAAPNRASPPRLAGRPAEHDGSVTVIVPVYADLDATRSCLDSAIASFGAQARHRLVAVDDACPDPALSSYLEDLARAGRITLLVNQVNLGFVGAVNRAFAAVPDGDVILLNADTVVPPGFVDRLAAAARSTPDVGTVTPMSNNGEFLSFPLPNRSNPLPSPADVRRLDAAARHHSGPTVDLPSGIGYCLYVTRACLDAVGRLSEDYQRGYLEDVDFCLRARARGFRNIAATAVFVGHAGSRSFAASKRALVVRNLAILERRFPDHRAECAAFMAADPLRPARETIERNAAATAVRPQVLVATAGPMAAIARLRGRQLAAAAQPAILMEIETSGRDPRVRFSDCAGGVPQSLSFALSTDADAFAAYLAARQPSRLAVFDPHRLPEDIARTILASGVAFDLVLADGDLVRALNEPNIVPAETSWPSSTSPQRPAQAAGQAVSAILRGYESLLAPGPDAEAVLGNWPAKVRLLTPGAPRRRRSSGGNTLHLGIMPVLRTPRERELIGDLAEALLTQRPDLLLTVLGAVADDHRLPRPDALFVTGPIDEGDVDHIAAAHGVTALMVMLDRPFFGHPAMAAARRCGLPLAAIDWSGGRAAPAPGDLAIAPTATVAETAACLTRWLALIPVTGLGTSDTLDQRKSARC